ncbi:hypothetical protein [Paraflavitalea speifideaquila]|uniref:hypothetical protein n=1 Tax=Paraflavitalea speifideaquila TaxID=3076558 RepID=UPI0028F00706|nr:hypothetical protein [Paraflavitalea speifideiaquila]
MWVNRLLNKTTITETLKTVALLTCIPIVVSYAYYELAADILFCLLVLIYTDIVSAKDLFTNRNRNIACGIIACLAYFAKTFGLAFLLSIFC